MFCPPHGAPGAIAETFCRDTVYRFPSTAKTNWERFVLLLSERIINWTIRPLTSKERKVFFKTCKSMLHLGSECRCLPCDALNAHVSLVFIRCMLPSLQIGKHH
ncbi:MAG: hypothetical protein K5841_09090 [Fretibacterium sp.]|nr:hypothetical protein [Fretibacterium sp.]